MNLNVNVKNISSVPEVDRRRLLENAAHTLARAQIWITFGESLKHVAWAASLACIVWILVGG